MNSLRRRLTYANVMSSLAVFLVLGGGAAFAASHLGKNSVGTKQLKKNAVTAAKIKANAVTTAKIADGAVIGAKVQASTLGTVPSAQSAATAKVAETANSAATAKVAETAKSAETANSAETADSAKTAETASSIAGDSRKGVVRAQASAAAASFVASEAASPEIPLLSAAPFSFYAKCFDFGTETFGITYIKTSESGAVFAGIRVNPPPFLDVNTAESSRRMSTVAAHPNAAEYAPGDRTAATAPAGTSVSAEFQLGVKKGTLAGGNGLFGEGDTCMFSGEVHTVR